MDPAKSITAVNCSHGRDITNLVKRDLEARARTGRKKYGTRLKPHNGRNALVDAYQEALDLACYLRQAIEENQDIAKMLHWN